MNRPLRNRATGERVALLFLVLASQVHAMNPEATGATSVDDARPRGFESPAAFSPFQANDRVAFLGDSITASGHYVHMIRLFYATRLPDRPLRLYNCGIGGATAESSWPRIDVDCLDLDPTKVVINLGMNDTGGGITKYQDYMTRIMDRIGEDPERKLALIVPSAYDQTATVKAPNQEGKNDAIRRLGQWLVVQGGKRKLPVVDCNTPMLQINAERQESDPAFSVVGPDRVHPGLQGHTVMAHSFLRAQGIEGPVARVAIDATSTSMERKKSESGCQSVVTS